MSIHPRALLADVVVLLEPDDDPDQHDLVRAFLLELVVGALPRLRRQREHVALELVLAITEPRRPIQLVLALSQPIRPILLEPDRLRPRRRSSLEPTHE